MIWRATGCAASLRPWVAALLVTWGAVGCLSGSDHSVGTSDDLAAYLDMPSSNLFRLLADPVRPYVYASDGAGNAVRFFNTDTYRVDRSVLVGSNPSVMDMKPDGSVLFVALHGASSIAVVDLSTRTSLEPIAVPGTPEMIAVGSNNRLYVSVSGGSLYVFDVASLPATAVAGGPSAPTGILSGGTADRNRIFTHDASTDLALTEWAVSSTTETPVLSRDISSGPALISSSPDGATFTFTGDPAYFGTRWPEYDGDVPVFRTADLLRAGTVNVQLDPVAAAICPGRIAVAHSDIVTNPTTTTRHSQGTGDLHTFDAAYVESTRYHLRAHVKQGGIACGPDGRIYLILGVNAGTGIGVIPR